MDKTNAEAMQLLAGSIVGLCEIESTANGLKFLVESFAEAAEGNVDTTRTDVMRVIANTLKTMTDGIEDAMAVIEEAVDNLS